MKVFEVEDNIHEYQIWREELLPTHTAKFLYDTLSDWKNKLDVEGYNY
ncbi:hypothetical protein SAMN04487897_10912 [Paenibacillus sp. yr247]|nr:hypothetical protein [Paenibacillus sp. yr247]SDO15044.1 hypothetical protein SAMN04487897_10912 [Paenibacillus sp. yr247]